MSIIRGHLNIILDSSLAKLQNKNNNKSHDFKIFFNPAIELDRNKNYKIALNRLMSITYSWYNVAQRYQNNTYKWRKTGEKDWKTETIPDGVYKYSELNDIIQEQTGKVDPDKEDSKFIFNLCYKTTTYRVYITIQNGYELDLTTGDFAELLGFEKKVYTAAANVSAKLPNITRGVDWIFIHCDCVSRKINNAGGDVLFALSTSNLKVGDSFSFVPFHLEWHPVNRQRIDSIGIRVTDGRNNILDLNDIDLALSVIIEEDELF